MTLPSSFQREISDSYRVCIQLGVKKHAYLKPCADELAEVLRTYGGRSLHSCRIFKHRRGGIVEASVDVESFDWVREHPERLDVIFSVFPDLERADHVFVSVLPPGESDWVYMIRVVRYDRDGGKFFLPIGIDTPEQGP